MNTDTQIKEKGFSLVEALVAIFILSVAVVAPLQIAYQGIAATTYAKNQLTAQYLAQDVAEYIAARKEEAPSGWLTTFSSCLNANGCVIKTDGTEDDVVAGDVIACGATCPLMRYNTSTNSYTESATVLASPWKDTTYRRKVFLSLQECPGDGQSIRNVLGVVTVSWGSSLDAKKTYTLRTNFYFEDSSCN